MRVWKGNDPAGGTPLILSEGFDSYNSKPEQYYRQAGKDLINCLLTKGFDVYVINYYLNSQSIQRNGAVFQSAIRFVSNINNNKKVIASGMSMGGVINRFACAQAEHVGNPLPVSKFLTLDSPHQGAVISKDFQDWRKGLLDESAQNGFPDPFSELASKNDAAKELLNYHAYDPGSGVHSNFFNYLNSLNGDGYPHLAEKIGVSFGTSNPNPNNGTWLFVHITGVPNFNGDKNFSANLSTEELVPGSYLPAIQQDGFPVTSPKWWISWFILSTFRPFSNPYVTINEYQDPTFIPYTSSLDIVNNVSKFDKTIVPAATSHHDIVPSDVIAPLVNALIEKKVYKQNITYSGTRSIIASENIYAGYNVTPTQPVGNVNVNSGSNITFKAGQKIFLQTGFKANLGSRFTARIEQAQCDGNIEFQNRSGTTEAGESDHVTSEYQLSLGSQDQVVYEPYNIIRMNERENELKLYPNPTAGPLKARTHSPGNLSYKILNNQGIVLQEGKNNQKEDINTDSLTPGLYFIELTNENGETKTFKIVKT
jgi:hypothetical protein